MATAKKRSRLEETLTRHQVLVQRLATGHAAGIDPVLRAIRREIAARIAAADPLTEYSRGRLEQQLEALDKAVGQPLNEFGRGLLRELREFGAHEAAFSARALSDALPGFEAVLPAPVQVRAALLAAPLGKPDGRGSTLLADYVKDWTAAERRAVTGAIRLGIFRGETNAQIVRSLIGTAGANFEDGLVSATRRNAATVVHTAVQHVSSVARQLTFEENTDAVKAVRWISTLDSRTCTRCAGLDRQVFALKKGPRPPLHLRCRCTVIAVLKDEFAGLQRGGTRASAGATGGKQVPAGISYFEWLKQQPAGFQDVALGPTRAKLLRDGGLSAARFAQLQLDRKFAPMTLEQMRRLEPLAFTRAGL